VYTQRSTIAMATLVTRVFINGNSQAVRIPQEFRLQSSQVEISRNDDGDLVLHPLPTDRGMALLQALEGFDDSLAAELATTIEADRGSQSGPQERDPL